MNVQVASISRLGLGCARIGSFNNPQPLSESRALIAHALDRGISLIDTSNIYGQGDSETQIGLAVQGMRDKAFIVTKTGRGFSNKMRLLRPLKPLLRPLLAARKAKSASTKPTTSTVTARREQEMRFDWSPTAFAPSLEASLRRLGTDRVDGFLLHSPHASDLGNPAIGEALGALKQAGKVIHFGVSCDDKACLDAALTMPGLSLLQLPWDMIVDLDAPTQEFMKANGILVLAREVIRLQTGVSPAEAVQIAVRSPMVDCALVGTTSRLHLDALADAVENA
jgi:aryl-alcohol dehydrogenase-like predicted oxidoreductase